MSDKSLKNSRTMWWQPIRNRQTTHCRRRGWCCRMPSNKRKRIFWDITMQIQTNSRKTWSTTTLRSSLLDSTRGRLCKLKRSRLVCKCSRIWNRLTTPTSTDKTLYTVSTSASSVAREISAVMWIRMWCRGSGRVRLSWLERQRKWPQRRC